MRSRTELAGGRPDPGAPDASRLPILGRSVQHAAGSCFASAVLARLDRGPCAGRSTLT